jgi:hypothetical protein
MLRGSTSVYTAVMYQHTAGKAASRMERDTSGARMLTIAANGSGAEEQSQHCF